MSKPRLHILCATLLLSSPALAQTADLTAAQTARLITRAEIIADPQGWATDMLDALSAHDLPRNKENICATIAIIDQESGFRANPEVPGLGKISEQAIQNKFAKVPILGRVALNFLEANPTPETSFMKRIRAAKSERDLDLAYRALLTDASKRTSMDLVLRSGLFNQLIEDKNEIDTAGSMQVSVKFAIDMTRKSRWLPMMLDDIYAVRDRLYTREGGMYFGIAQLLAYDTGYPAKIYRFADYNAGRYASRNAAFQSMLAKLTKRDLATDGDLLAYGKAAKVLSTVTATESAMREAAKNFGLNLSESQIRKDFVLEKEKAFTETASYRAIHSRFAAISSAAPLAQLPDIELNSLKVKGFTTARFARKVNERFQFCMAAKI